MKRTALYLRVSSDKQAKEGDSLDAQLHALRKYISDHPDLINAGEYIDDGVSGTKYSERDELQRLISDVEDDKIDLIIFTKLDRWFRSVKHYTSTQDILDAHNVEWIAIWEPMFSTTTPQSRLILNQMMSIAQFEAEHTSQRIKQVQAYKLSQHEVISGRCPAGFEIIDKHLVHSEDASHVKRAFEHYAMYGNITDTMRHFGGIGGMPMTKVNFMRMLKNPLYKGMHKSGIEGYCDPIVSAELWDDVQRKLSMNVKKSQKQTYIFSGLVRCAECGKVFGGVYRVWHRQKGDVVEKKYRCTGRYARIPHACGNKRMIFEKTLEKTLISRIPTMALSYDIEETKRIDNSAQIKKIERKLERLKDLYVEEMIDMTTYKTDRETLLAEMDKLSQDAPEIHTADFKALLNTDLWELYATFTDIEKRTFWRGTIREITIDIDGKIDIYFL